MVLQHGVRTPVWGAADPGTQVEVVFAGQHARTQADVQGQWMVRLIPLEPSAEGAVLSVSNEQGAGQKITDVLVGDVWLCSGQSNMRFTVAQSQGAAELMASANIPGLRLLHMRDHAKQPVGLDPAKYFSGTWACASPEQARDFSGVAFAFGRELSRHSKTPIGLIQNAVGGSPMISWLPDSAVHARPEYRAPEGAPIFMSPALRGWVRMAIRRDLKVPNDPITRTDWPSHPFQPSYLYIAGIMPLMPMALRGVIWYQGESDAEFETPALPTVLLQDLVRSWRDSFQNRKLPFLMVQLPRIDGPDRAHWPVFREIQRRAMHEIPGVYTAVTMDLGVFGSNVHPPVKTPIGERLARIALDRVYGERTAAFGPDFTSARSDGQAMLVSFEYAEGLRATDGKPLRGFELAGADGVFHPADATIEGKTVRVTSGLVAKPTAVRYGWHMNADLNLANGAGLPAYPFSSVKIAADPVQP